MKEEEGLSRRCRPSGLSLAAAPPSPSEPSPSPSSAGAPEVVAEVPDLPDLRSEAVSSPEVKWPSVPVPPPPATYSFSSASSISASGSSSSESSSSKPGSSNSERPPSSARAIASVLCSAASCSTSFDAVPLASAGAACPAAREAIAAPHALSSPARDGLAGLGDSGELFDDSGELFLLPSAFPGRPLPLEPGVRVRAGAAVSAGDAPFLCAFGTSADDDAARSRTAVRPAPTVSSELSPLLTVADDGLCATSPGGASSAAFPSTTSTSTTICFTISRRLQGALLAGRAASYNATLRLRKIIPIYRAAPALRESMLFGSQCSASAQKNSLRFEV
jgi:hypothetical protein